VYAPWFSPVLRLTKLSFYNPSRRRQDHDREEQDDPAHWF
jgi:hypothetical protein